MVRAYALWAFHRVGYWVRPYDMLADRRRWFWQPQERCFSSMNVVTDRKANRFCSVCRFWERCPDGDR